MIYRSPNFISSLFFNCSIRRTVTVKTRNIYKKQHGARPCVEKMQFIFFVPPNEELEGTLHPQKFGCTPKNVPPDEKTRGHAEENLGDFQKACIYFNVSFPATACLHTFFKTNVLQNNLERDAINKFGIKYLISNHV